MNCVLCLLQTVPEKWILWNGTAFVKIFEGIGNNPIEFSHYQTFFTGWIFSDSYWNLRTVLTALPHLHPCSWPHLCLWCLFWFVSVFLFCCRLEMCNLKWSFKESLKICTFRFHKNASCFSPFVQNTQKSHQNSIHFSMNCFFFNVCLIAGISFREEFREFREKFLFFFFLCKITHIF